MRVLRPILVALAVIALFSALSVLAAAHETGGGGPEPGATLESKLRHNSVQFVIWGGAAVIALVVMSAFLKNRQKKMRKRAVELPPAIWHGLFFSILAIIMAITLYVAGSTIYLNVVSATGGPVHWHADFEVWGCGSAVDLINPTGFSNRVGEPVLHEHGDDRIHLEGVVVSYGEATLGRFFRVVGGDLHKGRLSIPTDSGVVTLADGDLCNGKPGTLQVFAYHDAGGAIVQEKLVDYESYVIAPHGQVPPGDCIIVEFGPPSERTEHMCETYEVALKLGKIKGESGGAQNGG